MAYTGRLPRKGTPSSSSRNERVRISMVEVYEGGGKSVIEVCEETSEGYHLPGTLNGLERDMKTFGFIDLFIFKRRRTYRSVVSVTGLSRDKFTMELNNHGYVKKKPPMTFDVVNS